MMNGFKTAFRIGPSRAMKYPMFSVFSSLAVSACYL